MTVTGTVQWMLGPLCNIYRLFKGKEGKLVSCHLCPSARLKIGKGARGKIRKDWWKISLATHEILSLGRVVGCVLVFNVEFNGRGFMRTPESMGKWFYAVERLREPVPCVDLKESDSGCDTLGETFKTRVCYVWRWCQRMFLHWARPSFPLLEPVLYGGAPNTLHGPHGRSQHGHVQSSALKFSH